MLIVVAVLGCSDNGAEREVDGLRKDLRSKSQVCEEQKKRLGKIENELRQASEELQRLQGENERLQGELDRIRTKFGISLGKKPDPSKAGELERALFGEGK